MSCTVFTNYYPTIFHVTVAHCAALVTYSTVGLASNTYWDLLSFDMYRTNKKLKVKVYCIYSKAVKTLLNIRR